MKGGLKNVDINLKIKSLQCLWIQKLYDDSFYEWKLIPLYLDNCLKRTEFQNFYSENFPRILQENDNCMERIHESNLHKSPFNKKQTSGSKKLYNIIILNTKHIPTSQKYFQNLFLLNNFEWNFIYLLSKLQTWYSLLPAFQYKILNNIQHLR